MFDFIQAIFDILINGDYTGVLAGYGFQEDSALVDALFNIREALA